MTSPLAHMHHSIAQSFRGDAETIDTLLCAYLAGGHVLIEDRPGVGKTTLARALAASMGGRFQRIQCTPDLTPADITGLSIYDERERSFVFHPGPVFCDVLLADELNRTPPRTQSALLEAMSEGQITVDGDARALSDNFFCIATQNPIDHAGTYPLPQSQCDRFMIALSLGYPNAEQEAAMLESDGAEQQLATSEQSASQVIDISALRHQCRAVRVHEDVRNYIISLMQATRDMNTILCGASPRAGLSLQRLCQAHAMMNERDFVIPQDVQRLAPAALAHRITARVGHHAADAISDALSATPVPR